MAETKVADLIVPEVWADMAQAKFKNAAIVGTSSAVLVRDDLVGVPGDTVKLPRFKPLGEMEDLTEGEAMTPELLAQEYGDAKIKEAGKAVEFTDTADLVGLGNLQDEALRQFGIISARKVDGDLITSALKTFTNGITQAKGGSQADSKPLEATISDGLNWDGLVDALEKFEDDFEPAEFSGLYIRAEQRSQVMKDKTFIRASELDAGGAGSIVSRGLIGSIGGLNVYVTNRLPSGKAVILKRNSLALMYKRRPIVERDRDILKRTTVVATNMHYATGRVDDKGVLALTIS